jgi:hypothetical protein
MKEQLYQDFTTKLLPKIADGLTVTKEYFLDLFGRYVKYLIIKDSIGILVSAAILVSSIITLIKLRKKFIEWDRNYNPAALFVPVSLCVAIIITFASTLVFTNHLVKDIYIPEIRIYESLRSPTTN